MGNAVAEGQFANVQPPVQGKIIAITLDAISRIKDLGSLALGDAAVERGGAMYLTMQADVAWFYKFNDQNAGTVDEAAADAAAAAITFQANACARAAAGEVVRVRINRKNHRYLLVKGSGAGVLRMWVSSEGTTR